MAITYKYSACSNGTWCNVVDIMDSGHHFSLGMKSLTIHEMLSGLRTTNEGDINLCNGSVLQKVGMKNGTHAHKLWVEKGRRNGVLAMPILMKDWNINAQVHPGLAHPSNLLMKFGHPDIWFEEVALTGTQNQGAAVTNPVCSIVSLRIEAIHKLLCSE